MQMAGAGGKDKKGAMEKTAKDIGAQLKESVGPPALCAVTCLALLWVVGCGLSSREVPKPHQALLDRFPKHSDAAKAVRHTPNSAQPSSKQWCFPCTDEVTVICCFDIFLSARV